MSTVPAFFDENRHFVGDEADVATGVGDNGEERAIGDTGNEEEGVLHFNDDLVDGASPESPGRTVREANEAAGDSGETVYRAAVKSAGGANGRPSEETTIDSDTPGTRSTKLFTSQLMLRLGCS
ncbi:MAG: hypothetical protein R2706_17215 [Acidimicrobiales bacterium]